MANCYHPLVVRGLDYSEHGQASATVPCGRCPMCLKRRVSGWSFRLMEHERHSISSRFVTLTYADGEADRTPNRYLSLRRSHCQSFFNKLRKYELRKRGNTAKISYYIAGEYGTKRGRPHYHALIFNASDEGIIRAWTREGNPIGNIHFGSLTTSSVGYTLKYMFKPSRIPLHGKDDRVREFSLMSKGLGSDYLSPEVINWHRADLTKRHFIPLGNGKKAPLPRYYRDKIYTDSDKLIIQAEMILLAARREEEFKQRHGPRAAIMRELICKREWKKFVRLNEIF